MLPKEVLKKYDTFSGCARAEETCASATTGLANIGYNIECPECGNKVSDQAANCPHCGFKVTNKIGYTEKNMGEIKSFVQNKIDNSKITFRSSSRKRKCTNI